MGGEFIELVSLLLVWAYGDLWMNNHASRGLVWVQKLLIKRPRTLLLQSRLHLTGVTASVTRCRPWLHTEYIKVKHTPVQLAGAAGTALTGHTMCAKPQCDVTMIAPRRTILVHHRSSARGPHSVWQYRVTGSRWYRLLSSHNLSLLSIFMSKAAPWHWLLLFQRYGVDTLVFDIHLSCEMS